MIDSPGLYLRTVRIPDPGPLVGAMSDPSATAWIRNGDGMVGVGEIARHKPVDAAEADVWWRELCRSVTDESPVDPGVFPGLDRAPGHGSEHGSEHAQGRGPGVFGSGLIAFGSFVFDPDNTATESVLIVPRTVIGRRNGVAWRTDVAGESFLGVDPRSTDLRPEPAEAVSVSCEIAVPRGIAYADGALSGPEWEHVVALAVGRITAAHPHEPADPSGLERAAGSDPAGGLDQDPARGLDKVVLARDLLARAAEPIDPRWLVGQLAKTYRRCWTYHVDGLVGATPEMLVRRENGLATSRVLAGTIRRSPDAEHDLALAAALARSSKDLEEHEYAVASVARALAPLCSGMNVPDSPYVLELPNVLHLATDVTAVADRGASVLTLAAALHPSAAVCGTPTALARETIAELERMDRQRYAGPVGWVDAHGDGEWGIALRCGQIEPLDPHQIRLFAGCGIVAGSDPAAELAEAAAKFVPMRDALGV